MKVLFLDRDGTIIYEPPDGRVDSLKKFKLIPESLLCLKKLQNYGFHFVLVSNQPGLGQLDFPFERFHKPQKKLEALIERNGVVFDAMYFCPHSRKDHCYCRKPKTGLIDQYLHTHDIDKRYSYVIGDRETDMLLAMNIGVKGIAVSHHPFYRSNFHSTSWREITSYIYRSNF